MFSIVVRDVGHSTACTSDMILQKLRLSLNRPVMVARRQMRLKMHLPRHWVWRSIAQSHVPQVDEVGHSLAISLTFDGISGRLPFKSNFSDKLTAGSQTAGS